MVWTAF